MSSAVLNPEGSPNPVTVTLQAGGIRLVGGRQDLKCLDVLVLLLPPVLVFLEMAGTAFGDADVGLVGRRRRLVRARRVFDFARL